MCVLVISVQFSSVMPALLVHHQPPKPTQTHVHGVGDAIQPSHPLSSPFPPAFNLSQHQGIFESRFFISGSQSIGVSASASALPMNIQDLFPLELTGLIFLQSKAKMDTFLICLRRGLGKRHTLCSEVGRECDSDRVKRKQKW